MTLKTLKDLYLDFVDDNAVRQELRQEAINHIKTFNEKIRLHSHNGSDPNYLDCISCRNMFVQIKWIKYFFNITDEELR